MSSEYQTLKQLLGVRTDDSYLKIYNTTIETPEGRALFWKEEDETKTSVLLSNIFRTIEPFHIIVNIHLAYPILRKYGHVPNLECIRLMSSFQSIRQDTMELFVDDYYTAQRALNPQFRFRVEPIYLIYPCMYRTITFSSTTPLLKFWIEKFTFVKINPFS